MPINPLGYSCIKKLQRDNLLYAYNEPMNIYSVGGLLSRGHHFFIKCHGILSVSWLKLNDLRIQILINILVDIVPNFLQLLSILYNGCRECLEGVCTRNKHSWTKIYSRIKIIDFAKDHMGFFPHWCNGVCRSRNKECCKL